ncbi:MAG: Yip1 family protein [Candidatus Methanofastidiosia archaeon]
MGGGTILGIVNPFRAKDQFQKLKSERKWMIALLLVFIPGVLTVAGNAMIQQKSQGLTNQYTEEIVTLTDQQKEAMQSIQGLAVMITVIFGIVLVGIAWAVKSFAFHLSSKILGGADASISSTMHLIAYTYIPFIFKGLLDIYRGLTYTPPPYEEFVRQIENPDILLNFVREHNVFFIWAFVLMVIAVREQYTLSTGRALVAVAVPYAVYFVLGFLMSSIGSQLAGGI